MVATRWEYGDRIFQIVTYSCNDNVGESYNPLQSSDEHAVIQGAANECSS